MEIPVYTGIDAKEALKSRNNVSAIDTSFSLTFEKEDAHVRGSGVLNIAKNGDLSLRVYSFGFLAFEVTSENGIVRSSPAIDKDKALMLTSGLRDCLFWWDVEDGEIEEDNEKYLVKNFSRILWVDKQSLFPLKQKILLPDDRELEIYYEYPKSFSETWYPSRIKIQFHRYSLIMEIKDISFVCGV
ncbi:MAG: hypothetical protein AB1390_03840 [Nitrospirota bacterium]